MPELIEPFERELRRSRRNDGFSNDGLSYSVADDFGKLWGQALAEYDARRGMTTEYLPVTEADKAKGIIQRKRDVMRPAQFYVDNPTAREPEDPEALRRELLDPLMQSFGGATTRSSSASRRPQFRTAGGDVYRLDDETGEPTKIIDVPDKPDQRIDRAKADIIKMNLAPLLAQRKGDVYPYLSDDAKKKIDDEIKKLQDELAGVYAPKAAPVAAVPEVERPQPRGFIGDPLGENAYVAPKPSGFNSLKPESAVKRPTRAMAREYVQKYGAKAKEQLAKDGFDLSSYSD